MSIAPTSTPVPAAPVRPPGQPINPLSPPGMAPPVPIGPLGWSPQLAETARAAVAKADAPASNPFSWIDPAGYASPTQGAIGYGVGFGEGLGRNAKTQRLFGKAPDMAGLWAMGFDPSDPNYSYKLWAFHQDKMKTDPDYKKYVTKEAAKNNWNLKDIQGITYGADWYYRDLARRMGQSHSFLQTPLGKVLGIGATLAAGAIPGVGQILGPVVGGVIGGKTSGNVLGGILGAAGGYLGAGGKLPQILSSQGARNATGAALAGVSFLNDRAQQNNRGGSGNVSDTNRPQSTPNPLLAALPFLSPTPITPTAPQSSVSGGGGGGGGSLSLPATQGSQVYSVPGLLGLAQGDEPPQPIEQLTPQQLNTPMRRLRGARNVKADKPNWQQYQLQSPLQKPMKTSADRTAEALRKRMG